MVKPSKREHDLALAAAISLSINDIKDDQAKAKAANRIYNPMSGIESVEEAYVHALDLFTGKYPD